MTSVRIQRTLSLALAATIGLTVSVAGATPANAAAGYSDPIVVEGTPIVPDTAIEYNGLLYVSGYSPDVSVSDRLYSFDGSSFTLIDSTYFGVTNMHIIDDVLYYSARDADTWYVLAFDGTSVTQTGLETDYMPIEFVDFNGDIMASVARSGSEVELQLLSGGSVTTVHTFDSVSDLTVHGEYVYFTATPFGGSGYQLNRTDTVILQENVASAGYNLFVWQDTLFMGLIDSGYSFIKMGFGFAQDAVADPMIYYPSNYVHSSDVLYFTGDRSGVQYVFTYDGVTATPLPAGPLNVSQLTEFDGKLFVGDVQTSVTACAEDPSLQCSFDAVDISYFTGTEWAFVTQTRNSTGFMVTYRDRLYVQDAGTWTYIELATLPNTGLDIVPTGLAAAFLLLSGIAAVGLRRRIQA